MRASVGLVFLRARNLELAIRSDIRRGADEEDGRAMLTFWSNALRFLAGEAAGDGPRE